MDLLFAQWECESGILGVADERRPQAFEGQLPVLGGAKGDK